MLNSTDKTSRIPRILLLVTSLVLATVIFPFATATPAGATSGNCAGTLIDTFTHYGPYPTLSGSSQLIATSYLYWDGTNNCVKTVKNKWVGTPTYMTLAITNSNFVSNQDNNYYSYYAGPISVNGYHLCVAIDVSLHYPNNGGEVFQDHIPVTGWMHCG